VIVSHDHYDHLDFQTVTALAARDVPFYTSLGVGAHLEAWGVKPERIVELDWWETAWLDRGGHAITAAPSQHFSGRSLSRNATLWSSFTVRGPRHSFFFSGDTGLTPIYGEIASRLGPFDLVMLEVGAFHPSWGTIHLGPENALAALELLGGGAFLPVHWGTFNLALHAWDDPVETLVRVAPSHVQLLLPRLGAAVEPAHVERVEPWWRSVAPRSETTPRESEVDSLALGDPID
jgi:L-ascorbate metabolism protein UlaG (beta-lactamase superfamily)